MMDLHGSARAFLASKFESSAPSLLFIMTPESIKLQMPAGGDFRLVRRLRRDRNPPDLALYVHSGFYPPDLSREWPKIIGEIGHSQMDLHLALAENRAAGGSISIPFYDLIAVFVNGVIYTDDCVFWLSKLKDGMETVFAYSSAPFDIMTNVSRQGYER